MLKLDKIFWSSYVLRTKIGIYFIILGIILSFTAIPYSYGHGLTAETLPSFTVDEKEVALFAQFIPNPELQNKQVAIELFDTNTKIPTAGTTYLIKVIKNDELIFEETFQRNNIGVMIDFIPTNSGETSVEETDEVSELEAMFGIEKKIIASSPIFKKDGLYIFEVKILSLNSFKNKLQDPITYNFGLSYPDVKYFINEDQITENKQMVIISYYDELEYLNYDPENHIFNFIMPFDWSDNNINQTTVVHEELAFSKEFDFLMNVNFSAYVNDFKLDEDMITIDDFSGNNRIIHFIIPQKDLFELASKQKQNEKKMEFTLKPENFEQTFSNEVSIPEWIRNNAEWWAEGSIADSDFVSGIQYLIKEGIMQIPETEQTAITEGTEEIPSWIKNNAKWWSQGLISDDDFLKGIQYLVEKGIIVV